MANVNDILWTTATQSQKGLTMAKQAKTAENGKKARGDKGTMKGRPEPMLTLSIRLSKELYAQVVAAADKAGADTNENNKRAFGIRQILADATATGKK